MNPSDAHSSLAALRQLKDMLDAGTITPQEFETLKRQLIFGLEPALPLSPANNSSDSVAPPANALVDNILPEAPAPILETTIAAYDTVAPNPAELATPPPAATPDWLAAPAASTSSSANPDPRFAEEGRNPLNLVFIIGGALVVLGLVLYLFLGRPAAPDEHLASGSQTAADSTAVAPEVGPQAEQITLAPAAAPETIRVAPIARPVVAAARQFKADSMAAPVATPPPTKVPATVVPTTTMSTDSTATTKAP